MRFRILLSDKDYLTSFVEMASKIDKNLLIDLNFNGLLFDDELLITDINLDTLSHQYPSLNIQAVCVLSPVIGEENLFKGPFKLFKFQPFDDIISKIKICSFSYFGGNSYDILKNHKIAFIFDIDVYSSDFIEQFAKQIVYKYGLNVLIFPLQYLSSISHFENKGFTDSYVFKKLVYLINKHEKIPIESFFSLDNLGFYYFKSSLALNPIAKMDDASFEMLIKYIYGHFFDVICFDIGRCLNERNVKLLQQMDKVILLSRNCKPDESFSSIVSELGVNNVSYINHDSDGTTLEITISELIDSVLNS